MEIKVLRREKLTKYEHFNILIEVIKNKESLYLLFIIRRISALEWF